MRWRFGLRGGGCLSACVVFGYTPSSWGYFCFFLCFLRSKLIVEHCWWFVCLFKSWDVAAGIHSKVTDLHSNHFQTSPSPHAIQFCLLAERVPWSMSFTLHFTFQFKQNYGNLRCIRKRHFLLLSFILFSHSQTHKQLNKQTDRQTDKQTNKRKNRRSLASRWW